LFGYSFVFEIMMILNLVPSFAISSWGARRSDDQSGTSALVKFWKRSANIN
jgi:hypothetical protein